MKRVMVIIVTLSCALLVIQWLRVGGMPSHLSTLSVNRIAVQVEPPRDDEAFNAATIYLVKPQTQPTVSVQNDDTMIVQNIGPFLDVEEFVEDTLRSEAVNVGETVVDVELYMGPSLDDEPRNMGEPIDIDLFIESSPYDDEPRNVGESIDVDLYTEPSLYDEPSNVGEILDPDTYLEPSPDSEPRNVGEYLDPDNFVE